MSGVWVVIGYFLFENQTFNRLSNPILKEKYLYKFMNYNNFNKRLSFYIKNNTIVFNLH